MNMIAYPPVLNAKRIIRMRKSLPVLARKHVAVDPAAAALLALENMNRQGFKVFRSRFMPAAMLDIAKDVVRRRGVTLMLIASDSQTRVAVRARNETMYLIKEAKPHLSSARIAQWFDRDHTSVLHGIASHAAKNDLPKLVGFDFDRIRRRNERIAEEKRVRLAAE